MSSSLNSRIARLETSPGRRRLLLGLAAIPLVGFAEPAPMAGLRRWGSGEFRRFGLLIYVATLWAGDDPLRPPLALQLTYRRNISGSAIAEASVKEMRQLGLADEATLERWGKLMAGLFPDVRPGDSILGEYQPAAARFHLNGDSLGAVEEAAFARAFFSIWLDARTSAPVLRGALLRRAAEEVS